MPTSNGQVSARDIRQKAVKTHHVFDEAVTTAKIADVAVTVEKTDEPEWFHTAQGLSVINASLTTTSLELSTVTVDVPSWVGTVTLMAIGIVQITNGSGGVQGVAVSTRVNDLPIGENFVNDVADGQIGSVTGPGVTALSTPGATIEISVYGRVTVGTNSANLAKIYVTLEGTR